MRTVLLLAEKDLRLLVRDRGALFWACVFPLIFATLFGAIFPHETRERRIVVAMVDQAQDRASKQLAQGLAAQGLTLDPSRTAEEASLRVRRGEAAAMLVVPAAFATGAPLALGVDPTKGAEAAWIEGALAKGLLSPGCALAPIERRPIADIVAPRTGFELAFPAAVLWGLIGCAGAFAAATVAERRSGTHLRLRSAPIRPITLLLGKLVACLVACTVDATVLLIAARVFFGVRVEKFLGLPVAIVCCAACFAGITVLLGSIGRTEQAVGGASWATLLLLAMVGGAMVPLSVMPAWMRAASCVSPVRWGISALEGATFRGLSVAELLPSCIVLVGFGLVSISVRRRPRAPGKRLSMRRILSLAEHVTWSQIVRSLVLARGLDRREFDVHFACGTYDPRLFGDATLAPERMTRWPLASIDPKKIEASLASGDRLYERSVLSSYVDDERRLFDQVKPDLVVSTCAGPRRFPPRSPGCRARPW